MLTIRQVSSLALLLSLTLLPLGGGCGSEPAATTPPDASASGKMGDDKMAPTPGESGKMAPADTGKMGDDKMAPADTGKMGDGKMGDDKMAPADTGKMGDDKMAPKN